MTAVPYPNPRFLWRDPDTDQPLVGGKAFFYEAGTTTLTPVWSDAAQLSELPNPVVLGGDGGPSGGLDVYGVGLYKVRVERADGTQVHEQDNVVFSGGDGGQTGGLTGTEAIYTSDHTITSAEQGYLIISNRPTEMTFALDPAATIGAGFMAIIRNIGFGDLVINPSGAETIDGLSTKRLYAGESVFLTGNGSSFRTSLIGQKKSEFRTVAELQAYKTDQPAYSVYVAFWDGSLRVGSGARYRLAVPNVAPSYGGIQDGDGRWYEIAEQIVNPYQFGAVGDGVANDTLAMQAWMAISRGKRLLKGTYNVASVLNYTGNDDVLIGGSGYRTSVIQSTANTGNIMEKIGAGSLIMRDVGFTTTVNRTGGAAIYLGGTGGFRDYIENCRIAGTASLAMFRGVHINIGTIATISSCYMLTCSAAAIVIENASGTGGEHVVRDCTFNTTIATPNNSTACQWLSGIGALRFHDCIVQNYDYGVSYQPGSANTKSDMLITGCTFEATSLYGVLASLPAASAAQMQIMTVADCNFTMGTGYCIATVGATNDVWINDIRIDCVFRFGGTAAILINAGITCSIDPGCLFDSLSNTKAMIGSAARPTFGWIGKTFLNLTTPYNRNGNAGWRQYDTIVLP